MNTAHPARPVVIHPPRFDITEELPPIRMWGMLPRHRPASDVSQAFTARAHALRRVHGQPPSSRISLPARPPTPELPPGIESVPEPTPKATLRHWIALGVVLAATFMSQVDGFIVTVASPSLQADLPATFSQVQLIGASYVLACAAGLITGGRLGDRYGRRRVFLLGVAVFTLASAACGLAPNAETLIAARVVQGAAAAVLVPQELALIRSMFLDEAERNRAIARYGMVMGLGVIAGLAGGGLLVDLDINGLGWRSAFLINVPIGVLILLFGLMIFESRSAEVNDLDVTGAGLTMLGVPPLLIPLIFAHEYGDQPWLWLSPLVGILILVVLAVQQRRRGGAALFPARVLRAPGVRIGLAAITTFFAGNAGLFLVFTYHIQTGLGAGPFAAGMMFVPLGVGFMIGSSFSTRAVNRFGAIVPVAGCMVLAATLLTHMLAVLAPPDTQRFLLAAAIGAVGAAQGFVVSPLIAGLFSQVSPDDAGALSGISSTVIQFGLAAGYSSVGAWYLTILGAAPGTANAPTEPVEHARAYTAAVIVLTLLALTTSVLCAVRESSTRRAASP